jgi:hypothetical protein
MATGERGFTSEIDRIIKKISVDLYPDAGIAQRARHLLARCLADEGNTNAARAEIAGLLELPDKCLKPNVQRAALRLLNSLDGRAEGPALIA